MKRNKKTIRSFFCITLMILMAMVMLCACGAGGADTGVYREKSDLLKAQVVTDGIKWELGSTPAGEAGHAVFLCIDGVQVYTGTGETLEEAWAAADSSAEKALRKNGLEPVSVRADVVYLSQTVDAETLSDAVQASGGAFSYGVAFDDGFETALPGTEMNSADVYEYETGGINLEHLNACLKAAGKDQLKKLPDAYTAFKCFSWICDESSAVQFLN